MSLTGSFYFLPNFASDDSIEIFIIPCVNLDTSTRIIKDLIKVGIGQWRGIKLKLLTSIVTNNPGYHLVEISTIASELCY